VAYTYDNLGRRTAQYDTNASGTKLAEWTYDTLAKGQSTSATRYVGADAYVTAVTGYDDNYRTLGTSITLPASEGPLAGTYASSTTYTANGSVATIAYPAAGGLPAETITTTYTDSGFKATETGLDSYLASISYDYDGTVLQNILGTGGKRVKLTNTVDAATRQPTKSEVHTEHPGAADTWDEQLTESYAYDPAGNITGIAETAGGSVVANQCFTFDGLRRLTEAWTTTSAACQSTPSAGVVGGTESYWHSYAYDTLGRRTGQTLHGTSGDTTETYTYSATRPHAVTAVDTSGPGGTANATYDYDEAGNTKARPGPGGAQTLTWDVEGELAKVTSGGTDTTFVYDADGNRLERKDPNGTVTVYMGSSELRKTAAGAVSATRYYGKVAIRTTADGLTWLAGDHHGTGELAIKASTLEPTRRRLDPFGLNRGAAVAWPGEKGFVGGVQDPTGLTHLGAREYDPGLGRFISVDPVFDTDDPQSMTGYAYCSSDPVNCIDADGHWGWKKMFSAVAKVADVISTVVPGPIGTALSLVSAGAYLASGNKSAAAWALAGAAAAFIPGGKLALKATRAVVGAARTVAKGVRFAAKATKFVGKAASRGGKALLRAGKAGKAAVGRGFRSAGKKLKDLNQSLKVRAGKALARKANRNRIVIESKGGRHMYDVAGKPHFEKSVGREIPTPHHKFQYRDNRSPSGFGRFTPTKATGWWGLLRIWRNLGTPHAY
jgi:RHS repeat-associated protein